MHDCIGNQKCLQLMPGNRRKIGEHLFREMLYSRFDNYVSDKRPTYRGCTTSGDHTHGQRPPCTRQGRPNIELATSSYK